MQETPKMDDRIKAMEEKAETIAQYLKDQIFVRIFSHNDGDGLTSAAIMSAALKRLHIPCHVTNLPKLEADILALHEDSFYEDTPLLFCDMGSAQWDVLKEYPNPVIILDHHQFKERPETPYFLNPEDVGLSGATMICGAGLCWMVAEKMDPANIDLASLALVGIESDRQLMISANELILEKAKNAGIIDIRKGLRIGDGLLSDIFMYTLEPYLDITGNPELIEEFLAGLGLSGKRAEDLTSDEMKTLTDAVSRKLTEKGCIEGLEACVGETYLLNNCLVRNICDLSGIINSCGNFKEYGLAVSLCLNDPSALEDALSYYRQGREILIRSIAESVPLLKDGGCINFVIGNDMYNAGETASVIVRYVNPEKPVICLNVSDGFIKVSGRGTRRQIRQGLNLSVAFKEAAEAVGGRGGGHNIASGGSLPAGTEDDFLKIVNEIIGKQMAGGGADDGPEKQAADA